MGCCIFDEVNGASLAAEVSVTRYLKFLNVFVSAHGEWVSYTACRRARRTIIVLALPLGIAIEIAGGDCIGRNESWRRVGDGDSNVAYAYGLSAHPLTRSMLASHGGLYLRVYCGPTYYIGIGQRIDRVAIETTGRPLHVISVALSKNGVSTWEPFVGLVTVGVAFANDAAMDNDVAVRNTL